MRMFRYEGYEVKVSPEALVLKPFKKIWDRDKGKDKEKAANELAFLYFYCDARSDYQYITDDSDRMEAVKEGMGFPKEWKPDAQMKAAIEFYKTFDTHAAMLIRLAHQGIKKVQESMETLNPTDTGDARKAPITVVKDYLAVLKMIPEVAFMIKEAEKAINDDNEYGEVRGSMEKTLFDDGLDDVM